MVFLQSNQDDRCFMASSVPPNSSPAYRGAGRFLFLIFVAATFTAVNTARLSPKQPLCHSLAIPPNSLKSLWTRPMNERLVSFAAMYTTLQNLTVCRERHKRPAPFEPPAAKLKPLKEPAASVPRETG
jgi:hypothetical protein